LEIYHTAIKKMGDMDEDYSTRFLREVAMLSTPTYQSKLKGRRTLPGFYLTDSTKGFQAGATLTRKCATDPVEDAISKCEEASQYIADLVKNDETQELADVMNLVKQQNEAGLMMAVASGKVEMAEILVGAGVHISQAVYDAALASRNYAMIGLLACNSTR
jgi:hypothetical protein